MRQHVEKQKITYPILFDCGGRMMKTLGLRGYPTAFLVGRDGKVVWEGILPKSPESMESRLAELMRPKPKPRRRHL